MAAHPNELPLPGLEVVGRGIYLIPHQPYQLKEILFKQEKPRKYYSVEADQTYLIPDGYEMNESPPMPANQALNQVMVEESFERFDQQISLDASVAASNSFFSIDASTSQSKQARSNEDSYYALRSSFIPLWDIYVPSPAGFAKTKLEVDIPAPFDRTKRRQYEKFFARYGTHYVKRAWVGGKANLTFTIAKSSNMSLSDVKSSIQASFGSSGSASANTAMKETQENILSNSECTVNGKGGDELKLAALSKLDEENYNQWLATIKDNPQVIELEVEGVWKLIDDEKTAKALQDAYTAATSFIPVSGVFRRDHLVYFLRGTNFSVYNIEEGKNSDPKSIKDEWPALLDAGFKELDAVLRGDGLADHEGTKLDGKYFFFSENEFVRFDFKTKTVDPGYPKPISEGWPGLPFERVDAALNAGTESVYFFTGSRYVRFNMAKNRVDEGYPQDISKRWVGVTFDRIDASTYWGDGKVYFFRNDEYIRYDTVNYCADPGFPKEILGSYASDWKFFN